MSLFKKSDVKNHFSPRHLREIHLDRSISQPDATGFTEAGNPDEESGQVVDALETTAMDSESSVSNIEALATSKSTQA